MSKGGFKAFRGSSATAESYLLERDSDKLDDYYREGKERVVEYGIVTGAGVEMGELSPEKFRAWMEHRDPATDEVRGVFRQRTDVDPMTGEVSIGGTPLYQETLVSVSKTLSLYAAADPKFAVVLERAMGRASAAGVAAVAEHAVTRVGPKGAQKQVKLDRVEFTSVQHTTSRAGDPHYHRHVQLLPVGMVNDEWRAFDGRVLYRQAERFNSAADLSISTDVEVREYLAEHGVTWVPGQGGGDIVELLGEVDKYSTRRDQIGVNRESLEIEWRIAHPGQEPGPRQRQAWDTHAWAQDRPTKAPDRELTPEAMAERVGAVVPQNVDQVLTGQTAQQIDPETVAQSALDELGRARSAWSKGDVIAAVDRRLAATYLIGGEGVAELRAAALSHVMEHSVSFLDDGVNVEGVRHYTSDQVLAVDQQLTDALITRALIPGDHGQVQTKHEGFTLSEEQTVAAEAIAGSHQLVVIQGAAGAGKTTMLQVAAEAVQKQGRRLVVVSPTKRGAIEAGNVLGTTGDSVHALLYRAGANVDEETGRWVLPEQWNPQPDAWRMDESTVLVVDEAGMLDQDTAAALHSYIDAHRVGTFVLAGDAAQLAAVGRGGYLARAAQLAGVSLDLTDVRRFRTPDGEIDDSYAELSLRMRDGDNPAMIFDELAGRGLVQIGTLEDQLERIANTVALEEQLGTDSIVIAPTNAAAQRINHAIFDRLVAAGVIDTSTVTLGRDGDPIAAGARVATRENDRELGVANRQTWTVQQVNADGRIIVADPVTGHRRTLDADYVTENVQLAYAVTGHGAQGMTVDTAHIILSDELTASGAYVGLTRGRHANVLHAIAYDHHDAREQFTEAFARDNADLGLEAARDQMQRDLAGLDLSEHRTQVDEEIHRLRHEAAQHEQAAVEALSHAENLEHRIVEYAVQLEPVTTRHAAEDLLAVQQLETAQQQASEWETYTSQLETTHHEQAHSDGTPVVEARVRADDSQQQAQQGGRLSKRGGQREADARTNEWQKRRNEVAERWGDAPERFDLDQWAVRAAARHPDVVAAKTSTELAHQNVTQAEHARRELHREQRRELSDLRYDVLGVRQGALDNQVPLDERTATKWAAQHRESAAQHQAVARQVRGEADTLDRLPGAEAVQSIAARDQQETPAAAQPARAEQELAELRQRQASDQQYTRDHGIGWR